MQQTWPTIVALAIFVISAPRAAGGTSVAKGATASRPNILFIVSEDNGDHLGCYGEPRVRAHRGRTNSKL